MLEYLGKQTRQLLAGEREDRLLCAEMFADPSLGLPKALSEKTLTAVFSTTNKMRNDWTGHGGVLGQDEAMLRNEQLLGEVQKLREVLAETWGKVQLIRGLEHSRKKRNV